jgi:hypothetical protein
MSLDVEERLYVAYVHLLTLLQVVHSYVVEILLVQQNLATSEVCFEKGRYVFAATLLGAVVVGDIVRFQEFFVCSVSLAFEL